MSEPKWWIPCQISMGQFSREFAVSCFGFSMFVQRKYLRFPNITTSAAALRGFLAVDVLDIDLKSALVQLPAEKCDTGGTSATVPTSLLTPTELLPF